ncbi:MAG: hypothetical protein JWP89_2188 [Schlesneria sp.]|nr:hypothetical protein [Schlesneria sp.]
MELLEELEPVELPELLELLELLGLLESDRVLDDELFDGEPLLDELLLEL